MLRAIAMSNSLLTSQVAFKISFNSKEAKMLNLDKLQSCRLELFYDYFCYVSACRILGSNLDDFNDF